MKDLLKHSAVAAAWLALWQILYLTLGRAIILPSPFSVARRMAELIITLPFWRDIAASLIRILIGYLSALVTGVAIGILTAKSKVMDAFLSPISRIVRATPVASFIMLLFLFLTKEHIPIVTSFLMVMPVVWSNVYEGITGTDVKLLEMARVFRLSFSDTLRHVYLPGIMPFFMAAAKAGMGLAWKAGIAAEVLAAPKYSIGRMLYQSKVYFETTDLFAWTLVIIILSLLIELAVGKLFDRAAKRSHRMKGAKTGNEA